MWTETARFRTNKTSIKKPAPTIAFSKTSESIKKAKPQENVSQTYAVSDGCYQV